MAQINWEVFWNDFAHWFWTIPPFGQFLVGLGLAVLIAGIIIGVYYLVKGVLYLIYYILKGVYYLIKGIFMAIYYFFEALYYGLSGKERPKKEVIVVKEVPTPVVKTPMHEIVQDAPVFCPDCGVRLPGRMVELMKSNGVAHCSYCGKGFKEGFVEMEG